MTWDDLQSIALGELCISYSDFRNMTLREIINAYKGYQNRLRGELVRVRWLGTIVANSNPFSSKKYKPEDLMRIDGAEEERDMSNEIEKLKEYKKKHGIDKR